MFATAALTDLLLALLLNLLMFRTAIAAMLLLARPGNGAATASAEIPMSLDSSIFSISPHATLILSQVLLSAALPRPSLIPRYQF